jgi:hypothetical protein
MKTNEAVCQNSWYVTDKHSFQKFTSTHIRDITACGLVTWNIYIIPGSKHWKRRVLILLIYWEHIHFTAIINTEIAKYQALKWMQKVA